MQLNLAVNGVASVLTPAGVGTLAAIGGLAPVGGFASGGSTEYLPLYSGSTITKEIGKRSTAKLRFLAEASFAIAEMDAVVVTDGSGVQHFNGFVVASTQTWISPALRSFEIDCGDHAWLMSRKFLSQSYAAQSDRTIVKDVINKAGLDGFISAIDANIDVVEASLTLDLTAMSALQAIQKVASITGAEWYLTQQSPPVLHYKALGSLGAAAFDVSEDPDDSTTFAFSRLRYSRNFREGVNEVRVLGGVVSATRVDVTVEDVDAKTAIRGIALQKVHVDSSILDAGVAELIGENILANYAYPTRTATFETWKDGLEPGTSIEITAEAFGLSAEALPIRRVVLEQETPTRTKYQIEAGDLPLTLPDKLKGAGEASKQEQTAPLEDGSGGEVEDYGSEYGLATLVAGTVTVTLSTITLVKSASMYFPGPIIPGETLSRTLLPPNQVKFDSTDPMSTREISWSASGVI